MKKKFSIDEIDCAACAAKLEEAIKKIPGVNDAVVNFMRQTLEIDADDELFDYVMKQAQAHARKIDADCRIVM